MAKNFDTEIRGDEKKYLKVFPKDIQRVEAVREMLLRLPSVARVNITESKSANNPPLTLTVYPNRVYDVEEMESEVVGFLSRYFEENPMLLPAEMDEVKKVEDWLHNYPESQKLYKEAMEKYIQGIYVRNTLDDMRLALELLLKRVLGNQKSLENQKSEIGQYQNAKGFSRAFTNMFEKVLDYYTRYQNDHVKHDDKIERVEIDFVLSLTIIFMKNFVQ
ncbi:MAG: hypothetical protein NC396_06980 [Bacteroides sp.]|nr:hypothetical protein [Bacteroides sp.]MCM1086096.1 hypothetical protein [Bacteroides sp.]